MKIVLLALFPLQMGINQRELEKHLGVIFEGSFDETAKRTLATARMLRDAENTPESMRVNEYIRRFERSMYDSVSVEFAGGTEMCRICDKPIWDVERSSPCETYPRTDV